MKKKKSQSFSGGGWVSTLRCCCLGEHSSRCDSIKAIFHCNREVLEDSWGKAAPPDHGTAFGLIKDHLATRAHYN